MPEGYRVEMIYTGEQLMKKGIFAVVIMVFIAGSLCLAVSGKSGPWKKVNEKDGVVEYTRVNPLSEVDEYKATGLVKAPVAVVESVLRDLSAWKQFMFMAKETRAVDIPGIKSVPDTKYLYFRQGLPWPVSDRDMVARFDFFVVRNTGEVRILGKKINAEGIAPEGVIHMPLGDMEWTLKPAEGGTEVTYQCLFSPGGQIPASVLNFMIKQIGVETIIKLRAVAKQPRYQASAIITQTPWPQEGK